MVMDEAYDRFDKNPTKQNSDYYGMALNDYRDFCVAVIDQLVLLAPEVVSEVKLGGF
jgi:hypothetical protein